MLKKSPQGYYFLEKLSRQKNLVHGFSCREIGNCDFLNDPQSAWPNIEKFLKSLKLKREALVLMEQIHGGRVKVVDRKSRGKVVLKVDGLITSEKGLVLGIKAADCQMFLFYDPVAGLTGVSHAGWRGLFKKIPEKMIEVFIRRGSLPENILVGVGPFIGGCCYQVGKDLGKKFMNKFGKVKGMITETQEKTFLDLGILAKMQLIHSGILERNLEFSQKCTGCRNQEFFSKRKDKLKDYDLQLGVISLKK